MNVRRNLSALQLGVLATLTLAATATAGADEKPAAEQQNPFANIKFEQGPVDGKLEDIATVKVPEGMAFIGGRVEAKKFITATENLVSNQEVGVIVPTVEGENWWVFFEFDPIGYVKDDEQSKLDVDAILDSLKKGTESANAERKRRGWEELHVVGWHTAPRYNPASHNLEWATRLRGTQAENVNYNVRLLGRKGVMSVGLVIGPGHELDTVLPKLQTILGGFAFAPEQAYSAFKSGDKVAEYGLTALVAGGVIAAAAKSGILGKIWKFLVLGAAALLAGIKKLFGGKKNADQPPTV